MMIENSNNFTRALTFTLKWEGGFSNDKVDPGGKTKWGISDAGDGTIDGLIDIDRDGTGDVKVEALTKEEAIQVYYHAYWKPANCDKFDLPLAVAVFDTAVNCGVKRANKWLKESQDPKSFLNLRKLYYYRLVGYNPSMKKYIKGWLNRLNDLSKYIHILSSDVV